MEHDTITITSQVRARLERLKRSWRLSTDQQVLERALRAEDLPPTSGPSAEDAAQAGLSREVYDAVQQLRAATKPLRGKSIKEIKRGIREQAEFEAGG